MPHLRTDAGVDLELDRGPDGTVTVHLPDAFIEAGLTELDLTPAEARMVGAFLNPAPEPVDGAELRARAAAAAKARRGTYDPAKTLPTSWAELATYARHQAAKGLEVAIVVAGDVPELHDLDGHTDAGAGGISVRVDPDVDEVPGYFEVGRNGQRIARYHLGGSARGNGR